MNKELVELLVYYGGAKWHAHIHIKCIIDITDIFEVTCENIARLEQFQICGMIANKLKLGPSGG